MSHDPTPGPANDRVERIGRNEAVFRKFNEEVRAVDDTFTVPPDAPLPLICECGDSACTARIEMTRAAYEELRSDAALFAVLPGHGARDVEEVVDRGPGYEILRKHPGDPHRLAEATDPRRGS